jgi:hypothetical protein
MTKAELRAIVIQNTNRSDKVDLINSALVFGGRQIQQARLWHKSLTSATTTLAANASTVLKPTDLDKIYAVVVENAESTLNRYRVRVVEQSTFRTFFPTLTTLTQVGEPWLCYEDVLNLVFGPMAQQAYNITTHYYKKHTTLVSDSDTPLIDEFDELLIAYASAYVFRSIEMFDSANQWETMFRTRLGELIRTDAERPAIEYIPASQLSMRGGALDPQNDPFAIDNTGRRFEV